MEATPIVFGGRLLIMASRREASHGIGFDILDYFTGQPLASHAWPYGLASAIVGGGRIHIFGATDWGRADNAIYHAALGEGFEPGSSEKILAAPAGQRFFNNTVCETPMGYYMAADVSSPDLYAPYHFDFYHSADLTNWKIVSQMPDKGRYIACPSLRYLNGWFYFLYTVKRGGIQFGGKSYADHRTQLWRAVKSVDDAIGSKFSLRYLTVVARSRDLKTFEGERVILEPERDDDINASDIDLAEFQGKTYFTYGDGNQVDAGHLRRAVFDGPLDRFLMDR